MWKTLDKELPKEGKHYPIWVIAGHSLYEFTNWGIFLSGEFFVNGRLLQDYGWTLISWYDLPDYK